MNPLQMHEIARDRQATLLATAPRERLASGGRSLHATESTGLAGRLLRAVRRRPDQARTLRGVTTRDAVTGGRSSSPRRPRGDASEPFAFSGDQRGQRGGRRSVAA
ncbi:MAG: hypothetical protein H0V73_04540 [Chloroflexi bacterium]|nr:hypothetical protein [Chloroflexota bacterium]